MEVTSSEGGSGDVAATSTPTVSVAAAGPNSVEKYPAEGSQGHAHQYYPLPAGSTPASWPPHEAGNSNAGDGTLQNVSYQYNLQQPGNVQDGSSASTSTAAVTDVYSGYSYPTSINQYGYGGSEYTNYYSNYQQQPNQSYHQAPGAYQNSGSHYQPLSSFQNTGSYAGIASYPSTYYNPGDYQTTGAYTGSSYDWSQGNYTGYPQHYASYGQDTSSAYSSSNVASTSSYHQQWADYYKSQTEVTCAPGTENTAVTTTTSVLSCPVPGVSSDHATPVSQTHPTYAPVWKPEPSTSALPSQQIGNAVETKDDYWKHVMQTFQNPPASTVQTNFQKPPSMNTSYPSVQDQQQNPLSPIPGAQVSDVHNVQPTYQPLPPPPPLTDYNRESKMQIPANPRIVPNFVSGLPKTTKDSAASSVTAKPVYVSVSLPKPNEKVLPAYTSDLTFKSGMFPASLWGYVERALARCKDEKQRAACQEVMKEMITKATVDGTLHSRDWDSEPLFPLPDTSDVNNEQSAAPVSSLLTFRKSPSRRTKSRWEPLPEEKPIEKPTSTYQSSTNLGGWAYYNGKDHKFTGGKSDSKEGFVSKFSTYEQSGASRIAHRPVKKQRFGDELKATENGDGSSDNDKESGLTAYYSGAIALANSPEERKRRENRSKRFEKGDGQRVDRFRPKLAGAGNLYSKRATALALSKTFDDGAARAVEDIDWDALTVKGTCKEIEKRYLRLTSAPDPSTVRLEEVLYKALHMVQTTPKNYLYKCDQLKSIRQDLTVQRIHNELTVKVYETHARLALEFGDLPEFNQCQSQLKSLYAEGIAGCHMEFSAYNLLSVIIHSNNRRELLSSMSRLSDETKRHEAVRHALSVRAAITSGNFVLFFKLYKTAPNLNACIMDHYVEKMRFEAVKCMSRAYRPTIPVCYISQVLGFSYSAEGEGAEVRDVDGREECTEWLKAHGAALIVDSSGNMLVDSKASSSSLYMPEPEDAVAHGDANLAVNDFLTRAPT